MAELNSLTLNGVRYDSFPDRTAREDNIVSGSGLSMSAVNLLIDILRRAVYTEDVSDQIARLYDILIRNTDDDTNSGDNDDTDVDTGDPYDIVVVNASVSVSNNEQGIELGNYNNGQRATLLASDGTVKLPITGSGTVTNYSLVRIPRNTEKITIKGGTEFTFGVQIFELMTGTKFSRKVDSGWIDMTDNQYVYDILPEYADGNHFVAINFRMDNASVFDVNSYTDTLSLYFGDVDDSGDNGSGDDNTGDDNTGDSGSGDENNGDVSAVLVSASVTGSSATGAELGNYNNNLRATLLTTDGDIKLTIPATGETTNYSLIRIPENAVKCVFTGTSEFSYGVSVFAQITDANTNKNKYSQISDSGWIDMTSEIAEYAISSNYAKGNHYISVNFKMDSGSTFDIESYKDIITARFSFA